MGRLCERPGCSEPASVAYGMRPEDLVFWLDRLLDGAPSETGVLCRRHADSMVVPRNWTLDDLRDPELHLFRPPSAPAGGRRRGARSAPADTTPAEQLELGVDAAAHDDAPDVDGETVAADPDVDPAVRDPDAWTPAFDASDDLDGLLAARSPLLARAFRGDDRPRR